MAQLDFKTNKRTAYQLPKGDVVSEPIFIPRDGDALEGDGYLLATIYRGAEKRSDLAVFDTVSLETGPIALAELSHRVPFGFHGNWRSDVGNWGRGSFGSVPYWRSATVDLLYDEAGGSLQVNGAGR